MRLFDKKSMTLLNTSEKIYPPHFRRLGVRKFRVTKNYYTGGVIKIIFCKMITSNKTANNQQCHIQYTETLNWHIRTEYGMDNYSNFVCEKGLQSKFSGGSNFYGRYGGRNYMDVRDWSVTYAGMGWNISSVGSRF